MKKLKSSFPSGRYILIVVILLVLVAIYAAARLMQVDIPEDPKKISVVVENSGSERWNQYMGGIDQAASDKNVVVSNVMTSYFSDKDDLDDLVTSEYLNGANVVITNTSPDTKEVANILMEEINLEYGGFVSGRTVAFLLGGEYDSFTGDVADQMSHQITNAGGEVIWMKNAPCNVSSILKKSVRPDIIVALDDDLLCQAAAYLTKRKGDNSRLLGFGCSANAVCYLDRGVIDALLVPDDFTLGYESLLAACDGGNVSKIVPRVKLVHPDEVYVKENEKLLFP